MWDKATPLPGIPGRGLLRLVEGRRGRGEQEGENPHGGEVRPGKLQVMAGCAGGENWDGRDSKTPGGAGGLRVVQLSLSKWMPVFLRASSRNSATSTASREQAAYSSFEASGSVI